jgi:hypothetical protein
MGQLQWAFSLIPDSVLIWIYYTMLTAGLFGLAAGWIIKWIPGISAYKSLLQLAGVVLTAGSLYLLGGYSTEMAWRDKVAKLEEQVKIAEQKSQETNTVIQEKVVEKTKVIKGKTEYITQYLDREVVKNQEIIKYIENCPVPKEIIDIHNQAADMNRAAEGPKK